MKKVLFVASTLGHIRAFHLPYLEMFKENGFETHVAAKGDMELPFVDMFHNIPFVRSPFSKSNISAYKQMKKIIRDNDYDIIHCHTPVAAFLTRLAAREARKNGTKVIYTAHGFHFFKGAPLINWLIYYPIEKLCSRWTDVLITINKEDFALAQKKMKAKRIEYVPGVGVDLEKFKPDILTYEERKELRASLGVSEDDKLLFSVGELNDNKNHAVILRAMAKLPDNVKYCIAGRGENEKKLLDLAEKLGLKDRFKLLGYRKDIAELLNCTDVFCFPSKREGLGLAAIEAMGCRLPIITSNVHGINDYSTDGVTGFKCDPTDFDAFAEKIKVLLDNPELCEKMGIFNCELSEKYDVNMVASKVWGVYLEKINVKN